MLSGIGVPGIILLVILALLLFGPNKLPELGRAVGRTFREFKDGARDIIGEDDPAPRKQETPTPQPLASQSQTYVAAPEKTQTPDAEPITADHNKRLPE
ncbi:twin-arginine translocase TatA/TatE family subunit [Paenibacillus pini]|uniref:Sec-independent protein translocase protein TatA n=1 Tax=Paenibacillus pini JCM 16418 TaxID=1236976 RepID=W7YKC4_9BACL|nr:twin-arginine translocase TatA/TatE family subunit [Paenibacillus pini]GAF08123.1 twin-arginine translocation protein TatA [Paenibacillus pini JCM 16418]